MGGHGGGEKEMEEVVNPLDALPLRRSQKTKLHADLEGLPYVAAAAKPPTTTAGQTLIAELWLGSAVANASRPETKDEEKTLADITVAYNTKVLIDSATFGHDLTSPTVVREWLRNTRPRHAPLQETAQQAMQHRPLSQYAPAQVSSDASVEAVDEEVFFLKLVRETDGDVEDAMAGRQRCIGISGPGISHERSSTRECWKKRLR